MYQDEFYAPIEPIKTYKTKFKPNLKTPFIFKSNEQSHIYETADQSQRISKIQQFLKIQSNEFEQFKKAKYLQINSQKKQEKLFYDLQFTQGIPKHKNLFSKKNQSIDQFSRFPSDFYFYKNDEIKNQQNIKQKDKIYLDYQMDTKKKSKSLWNQNSSQKSPKLFFDIQKKNQIKEQLQKTEKISTKNNDFIEKYIKNDVNKIWKVKTNRNELFNNIEADFQLYPRSSIIKNEKPFTHKRSSQGLFDKQTFLQVKQDSNITIKTPLYKQFESLKCDDFDYQPEYDDR